MPAHIQVGAVSPRIQYTASGAQTTFVYPFAIFEDSDLEVYVNDALQASGFVVNGAGASQGGDVVFDVAPLNGEVVTLTRRLAIERLGDFQESGEFRAKVLNDELDYLTAALQQVADDQARSVQLSLIETADVDTSLPTPDAGRAVIWNDAANGFVNGPNAQDIAGAQAYAQDAGASASAAAVSAGNASDAAAAASNSAQVAATAAASNMYASNENKAANFSVAATDDGKQFLIDTSAGDVTVTLPEGVTAADGFRIALAKTSADNNAVIAVPSGTDTINGGTGWQFSVPHGQSVIALDTTPTPDVWFAAGVGLVSPIGVAELQDNAKPYDIAFVAGFDGAMVAEDIAVQTYGELVAGRAFTLTGEQLYMDIAPTGAAAVFDIEKNGVTVYATKPQAADGANAGTAGVLTTTAVAAGDRLTFKCTQVGATTAGQGARFTLAGKLA